MQKLSLLMILAVIPAAAADFEVRAINAVSKFALHEPVLVELSLRNASSGPAQSPLGGDGMENYTAAVTRPGGERREGLRWRHEGPAELSRALLPAGAMFTYTLLLNEWDDFDVPGRYFVSMTFPGAVSPAYFEVDIGPRDELGAQKVCLKLVKDSLDPRKELLSIRALAYVSDPSAIPCLMGLVDRQPTDYFRAAAAMDGLARIGDSASVAALAEIMKRMPQAPPKIARPVSAADVLNATPGGVSAAARAHLQRIKESSADPEIRRVAAAALADPR